MTELVTEVIHALINKFDQWRSIYNIPQYFEYTIDYIMNRGNDQYQTSINLFHHQEKIITNNLEFIESNIDKWLPNIEVLNKEVKDFNDHIKILLIIKKKIIEDIIDISNKYIWKLIHAGCSRCHHYTEYYAEKVLREKCEKCGYTRSFRTCDLNLPLSTLNIQSLFISEIDYEIKFAQKDEKFVWVNPVLFCEERSVHINEFRKELARQLNCMIALRKNKFVCRKHMDLKLFTDVLTLLHDHLTLTPSSKRVYELGQHFHSLATKEISE